MIKRHKTIFIENIKEIDYCGNKFLRIKGSEFEFPFKVNSTETKHNLNNCESCKEYHKQLINDFSERLKDFPNCCDTHSKLIELNEFVVGNYNEVAEWSANKIMFSFHHYMEYIENENWYNEITNYIEYCIESYGSFPSNYGEPFLISNYFECLLTNIRSYKKNIQPELLTQKELENRTDRIINYLVTYGNDSEKVDKQYNLLIAKYKDWFKVFPFEHHFFKPLKEKFSRRMPIFDGYKENKYLGSIKRKLISVEDLTQQLINITRSLLSEINSLNEFEKGALNDTKSIELSLIIEKRRLELKEMSLIPNTTTQIYIRTIKDWLKDEKKFIKDIKPFLDNPVKETKESDKEKFSQRQIAIAYFFRKGKPITTHNYKDILNKYSNSKSEKILQKRVNSVNELTTINGHKSTDTKHLTDLNRAMRLLEVIKDKEAIENIKPVISTFKSNYNAHY